MPDYLAAELRIDTSQVVDDIKEALNYTQGQINAFNNSATSKIRFTPELGEYRRELDASTGAASKFQVQIVAATKAEAAHAAELQRLAQSEAIAAAAYETRMAGYSKQNVADLRRGETAGWFTDTDRRGQAAGAVGMDRGAEAISRTRTAAVAASGSFAELAKRTQEAHARFGVMANTVTGASTAVRLLTGESGFLVIEIGRMSLYMGRAITAAGGLALALKTVAISMLGNPVALAFVAIATAATLIWRTVSSTNKEMDAQRDKARELAKAWGDVRDSSQEAGFKAARDINDKISVLRGEMSPERARGRELMRGGMLPEDAQAQAAQEANLKLLEGVHEKKIKARKAIDDAQAEETRKYREQEKITDAINNAQNARNFALKQEIQILEGRDELEARIFDKGELALAQKLRSLQLDNTITEARQKLAIDFGGMNPSDFMGAGAMRDLQLAREGFEARIKSAGENETGGFGTSTTREARGFQFGFGAMGSVVGEQSEQKKTNEILKSIKMSIEPVARAIAGIGTAIP